MSRGVQNGVMQGDKVPMQIDTRPVQGQCITMNGGIVEGDTVAGDPNHFAVVAVERYIKGMLIVRTTQIVLMQIGARRGNGGAIRLDIVGGGKHRRQGDSGKTGGGQSGFQRHGVAFDWMMGIFPPGLTAIAVPSHYTEYISS